MESVDTPIVVYNVPKFTGVSLDPTIIHQLAAENRQIIGVKDSSGSIETITEITKVVDGRISVLAGAADLTLRALMLGGKGAVIAVANVFPALCMNLYDSFRKGNREKANILQERITHANDVLIRKHNQLSAIKEALRMQKIPAGYPRKPALTLESQEKRSVRNLLNTMSNFH